MKMVARKRKDSIYSVAQNKIRKKQMKKTNAVERTTLKNNPVLTLDITEEFKNEEQKLYCDQFIKINKQAEERLIKILTANAFERMSKAEKDVYGAHKLVNFLDAHVALEMDANINKDKTEKLSEMDILFWFKKSSPKNIINRKLRIFSALEQAKLEKIAAENKKPAPKKQHGITVHFKFSWNNRIKIKFFRETISIKLEDVVFKFLKAKKINKCLLNNSGYNYTLTF